MEKILNYNHLQGIHCETGAIRNLLNYYNCNISEGLIFGIGSGLYFLFFPPLKINNRFSCFFRTTPVSVFRTFTNRMNIDKTTKKFHNKEKSMQTLDNLLIKDTPVGLVVGLRDLTYFPEGDLRGNFNGHHIVIFGKDNQNNYLVSDSDIMFTKPQTISYEDLLRIRFPQKGAFRPNGKLFYINHIPEVLNFKLPILKGIETTCKNMLDIPFQYFGSKGIALFSKNMRKWEQNLGKRKSIAMMRQHIQLSEEYGTGGSGFRYLYASFLDEAATILENEKITSLSLQMRNIADTWQTVAVEGLRYCKQTGNLNIEQIADIVEGISSLENKLFTNLRSEISKYKHN